MTMTEPTAKVFAALLAVGLLSACQPAEPPTAEPPAVQAPAAPALAVTPEGYGGIKIGMDETAALATGLKAADSDLVGSAECHLLVSDQSGFWVMIEDKKVSRITLDEGSRIKTDKGLGVGSTEAEVKAAYGDAVEVTPHKYNPPPAHYLTIWSDPGKLGVRYVTDGAGNVTAVHAGSASIQYVEGCS